MCIILYKPKGEKLPKKETLKNCFINNSDGAGFMFTKNNKVYFEKGFTTFDSFYKRLIKEYNKNKLDKKSLVLHFRIGTSGGINKEKTHPFIISNEVNKLNQLKGSCESALVHNGILNDYVYSMDQKIELSDTQNFTKDFIYPLLKLANWNYNNEEVKQLINKQIGTSKIVILDKNDNVYLYGDFIKDENIYYSNSTYRQNYYSYYNNCYNYKNWYYDSEKETTKEDIKEDTKEKALPFEETTKDNKSKLKRIDSWTEAILFDDGYYFEPFDYIDSFKYYISKEGNIYEEDNTTKELSFIGTGETIKLY